MSLNILWIILSISIILYFLKQRRIMMVLFSASLLWFAIISFPFVPHNLAKSLENQYPTLFDVHDIQNKHDIHIVVLGGGNGESMNLTSFDQLSDASRSRLIEGLRLYKMLPGSYLVFTGRSKSHDYSHAEVMKKSAINIGVEESRIKLVPIAENTRSEAFDYSKQMGVDYPVILVTDAAHIPRAMFLFRSAGINPVPAPTNHMVKEEKIEDWSPSFRNIEMMDYVLHEKVGLLWAKLTLSQNIFNGNSVEKPVK
jgi:uncharacterized SAM-binding protein YcdF (DUF218 family)